jgi:hypothetical protein
MAPKKIILWQSSGLHNLVVLSKLNVNRDINLMTTHLIKYHQKEQSGTKQFPI